MLGGFPSFQGWGMDGTADSSSCLGSGEEYCALPGGPAVNSFQLNKDLSLVHSRKLFSTIANPIALYAQNALWVSLSSLLELNIK